MSCAVVGSIRIGPARNDSIENIAVYQITVSPAAIPNNATNSRRRLPG
jgi:hypothetical protein